MHTSTCVLPLLLTLSQITSALPASTIPRATLVQKVGGYNGTLDARHIEPTGTAVLKRHIFATGTGAEHVDKRHVLATGTGGRHLNERHATSSIADHSAPVSKPLETPEITISMPLTSITEPTPNTRTSIPQPSSKVESFFYSSDPAPPASSIAPRLTSSRPQSHTIESSFEPIQTFEPVETSSRALPLPLSKRHVSSESEVAPVISQTHPAQSEPSAASFHVSQATVSVPGAPQTTRAQTVQSSHPVSIPLPESTPNQSLATQSEPRPTTFFVSHVTVSSPAQTQVTPRPTALPVSVASIFTA